MLVSVTSGQVIVFGAVTAFLLVCLVVGLCIDALS
jgi:hypothetical protein